MIDVERRTAFTLLETLLALAISSFMLVVVFSLVASTARFHVQGNDQVLASQQLLGLVQDFRSDCIAMQRFWQTNSAKVEPGSSRAGTDDSLIESELGRFSALQLRPDQLRSESIALVGADDWLMLTLVESNPRFTSESLAPQHVVWTNGSNAVRKIPMRHQRSTLIFGEVPTNDQYGLQRTVFVTGNDRLVAQSQTLTAGFARLSFRYLANSQWYNEWNSLDRKGIPDGLEVRFFRMDGNDPQVWTIHLQDGNSTRLSSRGGK